MFIFNQERPFKLTEESWLFKNLKPPHWTFIIQESKQLLNIASDSRQKQKCPTILSSF